MPRPTAIPKKSDYVARSTKVIDDDLKMGKARHVSIEEQKQIQEQLGALADKLRPKEESKKHGDKVLDQGVKKELVHLGIFNNKS